MGIGVFQDQAGERYMLDHGIREISGDYKPVRRLRVRYLIPYIITAIIFSGISVTAERYLTSKQHAAEENLLVIHGAKAVDAKELRDVVIKNGLTVYWVGEEPGAKYILNAAITSGISVRYIPAGTSSTDATTTYREVGTFVSPQAFSVTRKAASLDNGVGFINVDGNAVYYDSRDPKNVYVGLKNKNIQVEVFDPRPDQALAQVMTSARVQRIR
ncbi:MAG: hypothetical protein WDO06_03585 [Actinomycetota bacterium]